jgi:abhydrolase domain-containing protein 6
MQKTLGKVLLNIFFQINRKIACLKEHQIKINQINSFYLDNHCKNEKTPIVFIHGFGDNLDSFTRVAAYFKKRRCIHIDLPGFSISDCPKDFGYTLESYGVWLRCFLDALGLTKCHLIGNSLGGGITLEAAIKFPEYLKSITLLDCAGVIPEAQESFYHRLAAGDNAFNITDVKSFKKFRKSIIQRKLPIPGAIDLYLGQDFAARNDWFNEIMHHLTQGLDKVEINEESKKVIQNHQLYKIQVPTLILWGDKDVLFPVEIGEIIHREIKNSEFNVYTGVGHCPQHEYPARVARDIKIFWEKENVA